MCMYKGVCVWFCVRAWSVIHIEHKSRRSERNKVSMIHETDYKDSWKCISQLSPQRLFGNSHTQAHEGQFVEHFLMSIWLLFK